MTDNFGEYLIVFLSALIPAAGALFSLSEKRKQNKEGNKTNIYVNGAFVFFVMSCLITIFTGIRSINQKSVTKIITDSIQHRVDSLQNIVLNRVIGDTTRPEILAFGQTAGKKRRLINFSIINFGGNPVYGIFVRLDDYYPANDYSPYLDTTNINDTLMGLRFKSKATKLDVTKSIDIPVLYPNSIKQLYKTEIDLNDTDTSMFVYPLEILWAGNYDCTEKMYLKLNKSKNIIYTCKIIFHQGGIEKEIDYPDSANAYIFH